MSSAAPTSLIYLPPELLIHVLSYLDIQSLISFQLVCKAFDALFQDPLNESVIWRNACLAHGLVGVPQPGEPSSSAFSSPILSDAVQTTVEEDAGVRILGSEPPRREWGRWREWVADAEKQRRKAAGGEATDAVWSDVLALYSSQSLTGLKGGANWKAFCEYSNTMSSSSPFIR